MPRLKILLLRPNSAADELIPPFGLGYLATAIRKKHEVKIVDDLKEKLTQEKFKEILKQEGFEVVGIQIFTCHLLLVKDYLKAIKEVLPQAKVLLGGPHPSCSPHNIFDYFPVVDFAFKGEGEVGLVQLLDWLGQSNLNTEQLQSIPGLIWRKDGETIVNQQIFVEDLDSFGMPAWDLMRPDSYPLAPHGAFFKNYPIAPIIITRGCPFACTYCAGHLVSGKMIRKRSINNVIEEIKVLYQQYGIKEIHIEDDNFTIDSQLVYEFCRQLKEHNLEVTWTCPNGVRLDTLSPELILAMKAAGLYSISVGVESGSKRILKEMKKNLTKETIREKIKLIRDCGLEVTGFFIIGYPTETKEDIAETIEFAKSLDLKRASFFIFKPFPGTEITQNLIKQGELKELADDDWSHFVLADAVYAPPGFTRQELRQWRKKALLAFYFRPKILIKFFSEIRNFIHLKLVLRRIYSWLVKAK